MIGLSEIAIPVLNGLSTGLSLALVAVGLTLVFGVMHVVNLAHTEFYMIGAYLILVLYGVVGNYWVALLLAAVAVVALALPVERLVFAPIRDREPVQSMIISFALLFISHRAAFEIFGGQIRSISTPVSGATDLWYVTYPTERLLIIVAAAIVLTLVWVFLEQTRYGLVIRASAQDIENARSLGIRVDRVYAMTFAISALLATIAAGFLAPIRGIYPTVGLTVLLDIFIIVIVGGMGSIPGAVVAALLIGLTRSIATVWIPPWTTQLLVFVLVIVVMLIRPQGIFSN